MTTCGIQSFTTLINFVIFLVLFNDHLTHPLVLDLCDLGVGVAHHGDQQVQQQDDHDGNEDEEVDLADELMVGVWDSIPYKADITLEVGVVRNTRRT